VVYHLVLEARRPPEWLSAARRDQHTAWLRSALGSLAGDTTIRWRNESTLTVRLRYEGDDHDRTDVHQSALGTVVRAADRAAMHATGAVVTRVASHWTQGAIAGALTGLGVSQTQEDRLGPAITLAAIALGAVAGGFLRREVPVYRALRLPYAGWRLVPVEPEASGPRFRVGLA
jgi:hypothetical protein